MHKRMSAVRDLHDPQLRTGRMKLLFVHARGGPVQPVPEEVLNGDPRVDVRTTSLGDDLLTAAEEELTLWADVIVVMEKRMRHILRRRLKLAGKTKRVVCLHLPEHHDLQDPAYLTLFRERIEVYLEKLAPRKNSLTLSMSTLPLFGELCGLLTAVFWSGSSIVFQRQRRGWGLCL